MKGLLSTGIILSVVGTAISATGLGLYLPKKDEISNEEITQVGKIDIDDSKKYLNIDIARGVTNVYYTTEKSYIDYKLTDNVKIVKDENINKFEFKDKRFIWFNLGTLTSGNNNQIDIYLNKDTLFDFDLEFDAGTLTFNEDMSFDKFDLDVSAGIINLKNVTANNSIGIDISAGSVTTENLNANDISIDESAGTVNLKNVTANNSIEIDISAGSITTENLNAKDVSIDESAGKITTKNITSDALDIDLSAGKIFTEKIDSSKIDIDLSAGTLNGKLYGTKSDYKVSVDKSAGSCNLDKGGTGSRIIDVELSAGSVELTYVGYPTSID